MPYLILLSLNDTFDSKTLQLPYLPNVLKIGRQTNKSTVPYHDNGFFDSKVLSRSHAEIWASNEGRACIKDIRSSNGTFVNGIRLSKENEESEVRELLPGDTLELGIDILNDENGTIIHKKVSARVDHAGFPNDYSGTGQNSEHSRSQSPGVNGSSVSSTQMQNGTKNMYDTTNSGANSSLNSMTSGQAQIGAGRHNVTIDMVIKRLSNDLQASKQVAADLKHTNDIFVNGLSRPASLERHLKSPFDKCSSSDPMAKKDASPVAQIHTSDHSSPLSQLSVSDTSDPLSSQLESARQELEAQNLRLQELETSLMSEREARMLIEEKWQTMLDSPQRRMQDDDAASETSSSTITQDYGLEDRVPIGMDEVSKGNGGGVVERLENLLRNAQQEIHTWKLRAESAETENVVKGSRILELLSELERSKQTSKDVEAERLATLSDKYDAKGKRQVRTNDASVIDKGGRGAAMVSMVGMVMLGIGLMTFLNDYGPKKDL